VPGVAAARSDLWVPGARRSRSRSSYGGGDGHARSVRPAGSTFLRLPDCQRRRSHVRKAPIWRLRLHPLFWDWTIPSAACCLEAPCNDARHHHRKGGPLKKRLLANISIATVLLAGIVLLSPMGATAVETTDPFAEARTFLTEYGVKTATQENLIASYQAGESWDSFSSESKPVKSKTSLDGDYLKTVAYYQDGSVSVTRLEQPAKVQKGTLTPMSSPNGCTVSGSSRLNCNVDMWVGLVSMAFKASYNLSTNTVSSVYGASWTIGGACSTSLIYLGRPASNIGRMDVSAQMCGVPYSTTFFLAVTVKNGVATESWNG
jgi:hypothetical protein